MKRRILPLLTLFFLVVGLPCAPAQQIVPSYTPYFISRPGVQIKQLADGNFLVCGTLDHMNGTFGRIFKINSSGQTISSFTSPVTNGSITVTLELPAGKILAAGGFTSINGHTTKGLVRLNSNGSEDQTFTADVDDIQALGIQSTGKVICLDKGGMVRRLNADGSIDATFTPTPGGFSLYMAIAQDDNIYINNEAKVRKVKPDGDFDTSFDSGTGVGTGQIDALRVTSDGKILVGGFFTTYNGTANSALVRITPNGALDNSFNLNNKITGQIRCIIERANHNIVVTGNFQFFGAQLANLVELKPDGSLERIIATTDLNHVDQLIETSDQGLVVTGGYTTFNQVPSLWITRLNSNYTINQSFKPMIVNQAVNWLQLEALPGGTCMVFGTGIDFFGAPGWGYNRNPIKVNALGEADQTFSVAPGSGYPALTAMHVASSGDVYISGILAGGWQFRRLKSNGSVDLSFVPAVTVMAYEIEEHDQHLYVGGTTTHNATNYPLAKLNMAGGFVQGYNLPSSSSVSEILFQSDGRMLVRGNFPDVNGGKKLLRINTNGTVDTSFDPGIAGNLTVVTIDSQDRIYLGGVVTVDGAITNHLARLTPDGELDGAFDSGTGFEDDLYTVVADIIVLPDNRIVVGGRFSSYKGELFNGLLFMDSNGDPLQVPNANFGRRTSVTSMDYRDGALYVVGNMVKTDHSSIKAMAKININPVSIPTAPSELSVSITTAGVFAVNWKDNSSDELAFIIERSTTNDQNFVAVDTVAANTTTNLDINRISFTKYYYRVKAQNDAGSATSATVSYTWSPLPTGSISLAIRQEGETGIRLDWINTVSGHFGFKIQRTRANATAVAIDTVAVSTFTFLDNVDEWVPYSYQVVAYNPAGAVQSNVAAMTISEVLSDDPDVAVFPIPVTDKLFIRGAKAGGVLSFTSTTGQVLHPGVSDQGTSLVVDVSDIASGVYIVRYKIDDRLIRRKVVKY